MRQCGVQAIVGYHPCNNSSVTIIDIDTSRASLTIDICQEHLDWIENGLRETGRIPEDYAYRAAIQEEG